MARLRANTAAALTGRDQLMSQQPPIVAVVGPTTAGKSDLAVELALALGGEVVNADSMQIYRGMDIGTAKLSVEQRRGVPHHLLDLLDVGEPSTVAEFQGLAREAIGDCRGRGVTPVLVGGSALYVRAVLDEFSFPGTDRDIRSRLEVDLAAVGSVRLHGRLEAVDPVAARTISPGNGRRIVRALEVVELTGQPFRATLPEPVFAFDRVLLIGVDVPRELVDERIARRVDAMWRAGFVDEVRRLELAGLREGRTASRALGYRQILDLLAGQGDEERARAETVRLTRRFARRQASWFGRDPRIRWLSHATADLGQSALHAVRSIA